MRQKPIPCLPYGPVQKSTKSVSVAPTILSLIPILLIGAACFVPSLKSGVPPSPLLAVLFNPIGWLPLLLSGTGMWMVWRRGWRSSPRVALWALSSMLLSSLFLVHSYRSAAHRYNTFNSLRQRAVPPSSVHSWKPIWEGQKNGP